MKHHSSILGVSFLFLSCASPTLGAPLDPTSAPSSPALGFNPSFTPAETMIISSTPLLDATPTSTPPDIVTSTAAAGSSSTGLPSPVDLVAAEITPPTSPVVSWTDTRPSATESNVLPSAILGAAVNVPTLEPAPYLTKLPKGSSSHKKLASRLKALNAPSATASSLGSSAFSSSSTVPAFATTSSTSHASTTETYSSSSVTQDVSGFTEPVFSTRSTVQPTAEVLDDPNPEARSHAASEATRRARRSAILAAFLILGTLGALGGGVLCFKCGVLPCCHSKDRTRRSRASLGKVVEEGLQKPQKPIRITSTEKSIIPGAPPPVNASEMPSSWRDSHTPSCSTCPDSMAGMKSGVSGGASSWRVFATNESGLFEDVTHVLSSDAFSVHSATPASPCASASTSASVGSWSARHSCESSGSGTQPQSSADSRADSRASGSGASVTAESYKSCESRYSTPSFERHSRDGPPLSASPSVASASEGGRSPSPPASVSVSVLLMTPEQADYNGLADAAMPRVVDATVVVAPREAQLAATMVETESEDMELDSQWDVDVAQAYGAPVDKKPGGVTGSGMRQTATMAVPVGEQTVGTIDVGGRTCVLMRG
ncbi:hypothetical protein C8Q79DRAFT_947966 [Trametes meyenii]|nr:hypothetical protein C8Q79DRAFT_947966 [Trametes meyenii]